MFHRHLDLLAIIALVRSRDVSRAWQGLLRRLLFFLLHVLDHRGVVSIATTGRVTMSASTTAASTCLRGVEAVTSSTITCRAPSPSSESVSVSAAAGESTTAASLSIAASATESITSSPSASSPPTTQLMFCNGSSLRGSLEEVCSWAGATAIGLAETTCEANQQRSVEAALQTKGRKLFWGPPMPRTSFKQGQSQRGMTANAGVA